MTITSFRLVMASAFWRPKVLLSAILVCLVLAAINDLPMFWIGHAPGDLGDARFNTFVLEHLFRWITGREPSLFSPPIFSPFPDTLFMSDTHFGSGIVYVLARLAGLSEYPAFHAWVCIGYVLSFLGAYYAAIRLGFGIPGSLLAAAIFAFNLPSIAQIGHAQLVYRFAIPLAMLYLWLGLQTGHFRHFILVILFLCLQMLSSIYLGMFLGLLMLAFALGAILYEPGVQPPRKLARSLVTTGLDMVHERRVRDVVLVVLSLTVLSATLFTLYKYYDVNLGYGIKRQWSEIELMIPRPISYLLMSGLPYWHEVSVRLGSRVPMAHEHNLFMGFGVFAFLAAGCIAIAMRVEIQMGKAALATAFCLVLLFFLTLMIGKETAYHLLAPLPGVNAIRAVTRIILVLAFPIALIAAVGLEALLRVSQRLMVARDLVVAICLGASYEFISMQRYSFPISEAEQRETRLIASARKAAEKSGVDGIPILQVVDTKVPTESAYLPNLDAMRAVQRLGWVTVNGYSGNTVPGAGGDLKCTLAGRQLGEYQAWHQEHRRGPDVDSSDWLKRLVFVGETECDDRTSRILSPPPRHREQPAADLPSRILLVPREFALHDSLVQFGVTIRNTSDHLWVPGASTTPVRLSWRFVPVGSDGANVGWDPRQEVTDIAPGGTLELAVSSAVPSAAGRYRLELSMVADGLFWFHDKGMPIATFSRLLDLP